VAIGSLVAAWFLGHVDQTIAEQTIPALHKAFFALGLITIVSSGTFLGLHPHDGNNISNRLPLPPVRGQMRAESRATIGAQERSPAKERSEEDEEAGVGKRG
jgi:hypothetical protein